MLNILLIIILIIISTIIILIISGIKLTVTYNKNENLKGYLKIEILKKIKIYSIKIPGKPNDEKAKDRDIKKLIRLTKPCKNEIINYIILILKSMKIKKIQNHIIFGMKSYADTGKYIGIIWAILSIINSIDKNISISAEPSFTGSTLKGYGENEIEINLIKILKPTIKLLLKDNIQKLIKGVINEI